MKRSSHNLLIFFAGGILAGLSVMACTQAELIEPEQMKSPTAFEYVGNPTDCYLDLSVDGLETSLATKTGDGPVDDTEAEREVDNLWLFQFDKSGDLISDPQYITIPADNQQILRNIPVTLSDNDGNPCILYVVTNTGDDSWVTYDSVNDNYSISTLEELKAYDLPTREPIWETDGTLSIPMGGSKGEDEDVYVKNDEVILVPVKRMYAKIVIYVNIGLEEEAYIYNVQIGNIPQYCRVETLSDDVADETEAAVYPDDIVWISRTFQSKDNSDPTPYVVYIPENLQGVQEPTSESESKDDPSGSAFYINVSLSVKDSEGGVSQYPYLVYPGADIESDYNIRRNVVYYITFDINVLSQARIPSANCFVVTPGETLSFYPYYREETGGGYDFENFLDPTGQKGRKIDHLAIVWQTKDCIGDNEHNTLVWLSPDNATHDGYEKIYVTTQSEGNALIAAYDDGGEIIWSWHIWVTDNDPANETNAVTYYTYRWDSSGIKYDEPRISGYQIMSCNLGALANEPEDDLDNEALFEVTSLRRTHGMLYQWGRKDPFPPFFGDDETDQGVHEYDDDHTPTLYGNDNTTEVHKTSSDDDDGYLFHSAEITSMVNGDGIKYSINNPTVFMCGTYYSNKTVTEGANPSPLVYVADIDNYHNNGAWSADDHDDGMWGATDRSSAMSYDTEIDDDQGNRIHIYDNYGDEKSIFDPCPYGWRVPPSDLWLGFTKEKPNPEKGEEDLINYDQGNSKSAGMYLFLGQTWRDGDCAFFPNQGFRLADGCAYRANTCGNYLNAMTDDSDRVNITHIHNSAEWFNLFETQLHYTVKADGNPVRCVRDKK